MDTENKYVHILLTTIGLGKVYLRTVVIAAMSKHTVWKPYVDILQLFAGIKALSLPSIIKLNIDNDKQGNKRPSISEKKGGWYHP